MAQNWPMKLFNKSVLKQRKYREITAMLGPTDGYRCLDIGGDNGVISYLLRERGGSWKSGDLDAQSVRAIEALVETEVYQLDGGRTPFEDDEFDRVVIVDFLEHIEDDRGFVEELYRITKPGGELIVNVPYYKDSPLRAFQLAIGQTDEKHGHVRPGYKLDPLVEVLDGYFTIVNHRTYSRFFSELIDTVIRFSVSFLKGEDGGRQAEGHKGQVVTGEDLSANKSMFRVYSLMYPFVWLFTQLDHLVYFTTGYRLVARATVNK